MLSGELTVHPAGSWDPFGPGDSALVHEGGAHGFRDDGDEEAVFLILFAPGNAGRTSSSRRPRSGAAAGRSRPRG